MGFFKKQPDPLTARSRDLTAKIAALETEIKKLSVKRGQIQAQPRLRSTTLPGGHAILPAPERLAPPLREPIFEEVDQDRVKAHPEPSDTEGHFNERGVRKYDLAGAWRRLLDHFHGPTANNRKFISYLAAGSIQGLRPLRYEKRVARRRLFALSGLFFLILWGILAYFFRYR